MCKFDTCYEIKKRSEKKDAKYLCLMFKFGYISEIPYTYGVCIHE